MGLRLRELWRPGQGVPHARRIAMETGAGPARDLREEAREARSRCGLRCPQEAAGVHSLRYRPPWGSIPEGLPSLGMRHGPAVPNL